MVEASKKEEQEIKIKVRGALIILSVQRHSPLGISTDTYSLSKELVSIELLMNLSVIMVNSRCATEKTGWIRHIDFVRQHSF